MGIWRWMWRRTNRSQANAEQPRRDHATTLWSFHYDFGRVWIRGPLKPNSIYFGGCDCFAVSKLIYAIYAEAGKDKRQFVVLCLYGVKSSEEVYKRRWSCEFIYYLPDHWSTNDPRTTAEWKNPREISGLEWGIRWDEMRWNGEAKVCSSRISWFCGWLLESVSSLCSLDR